MCAAVSDRVCKQHVQGDQSYCPPLKIHDPAYVAQNQWCLVKTQLIEKKIAKAQVNCAIP